MNENDGPNTRRTATARATKMKKTPRHYDMLQPSTSKKQKALFCPKRVNCVWQNISSRTMHFSKSCEMKPANLKVVDWLYSQY